MLLLAPIALLATSAPASGFWNVTSGSSFCSLTNASGYEQDACVTTGSGTYGNDERCSITAIVGLTMTATYFDTEAGYDNVQLTSTSTGQTTTYDGSSGPSSVPIAAGDALAWSSDDGVGGGGFIICATLPLPAPPMPPPQPPTPPQSPPAAPQTTFWQINAGASYCSLSTMPGYEPNACITDGVGNHGNNERCTITAMSGFVITATDFSTESCCDYMRWTRTNPVSTVSYRGTSGPMGVQVSAGDTFFWTSDYSVARGGFTVCGMVQPPSPPATPPIPPSLPPVPPSPPSSPPPTTPDTDLWEVTRSVPFGSCELAPGGTCVTDGAGVYGNRERCTFTALQAIIVNANDFVTELNNDYIDIGGTRFSGTIGPSRLIMAAGETMVWYTSSYTERNGFTICATPAPSPPTPQTPPLPPLVPNGERVALPRLDVSFAIAPVAPSVLYFSEGNYTPAFMSLLSAVRSFSSCADAPFEPCTVTLRPVVTTSGSAVAGRRRAQVITAVESIVGSIDWRGVNRTAACPPPPPKAPGEINLVPGPDTCVSTTTPPTGGAARAVELRRVLTTGKRVAELALLANGMSDLLQLTGTPVANVREVDMSIVFPPSPPPVPSAPPPPPSPPSPPSPPPGLCTDVCNNGQGNGVCEDGGPGSLTIGGNLCPLGSDCTDCGVRIFCVNCPAACTMRNLQLYASDEGSNVCFESDYGNGLCTPNCNNLACGYDGGDCSSTQIQAQCGAIQTNVPWTRAPTSHVQRLSALGFPDQPCTVVETNGTTMNACSPAELGLVPVNLQLNMEPGRLLIHDTFKEMMVLLEIEYDLQWEDARLFTHPCFGALDEMLSVSRDVGRSDNARSRKQEVIDDYWMVRLGAENYVPGFEALDELAEVSIQPSVPWINDAAPYEGQPNAPSTCENCVTRHAEVELEVMQSHFDFYFYPFDSQIMKVRFFVTGAHIYTCTNRTAMRSMLPLDDVATVEHKMLPFTAQWKLASDAEKSLTMKHPIVDGVMRYDMCDLELKISRSFMVFFVKSMITSLVVVGGSLFVALFMHPEELAGDRCQVLLIAFLILVYNMQLDLGLAAVTYLLWLDVFHIVQCCMVLLALTESTVCHYLLKTQRDRMAIQIDKVLRITIPCILYPVVTLSTIIWGLEQVSLCPDTELCGVGTGDPRFWERGSYPGFKALNVFPGMTMSNVAAIFGVFAAIATFVLSFVWIALRFRYVAKEQVYSIMGLIQMMGTLANPTPTRAERDMTEEERQQYRALEWQKATERVFNVFDLDDSGSVDGKELRQIIQAIYPASTAQLMRAVMVKSREYMDAEGELDVASFQDAIAVVMEYMMKKANEGEKGARPISNERSRKFVKQLNFWRGDSIAKQSNKVGAMLTDNDFTNLTANLTSEVLGKTSASPLLRGIGLSRTKTTNYMSVGAVSSSSDLTAQAKGPTPVKAEADSAKAGELVDVAIELNPDATCEPQGTRRRRRRTNTDLVAGDSAPAGAGPDTKSELQLVFGPSSGLARATQSVKLANALAGSRTGGSRPAIGAGTAPPDLTPKDKSVLIVRTSGGGFMVGDCSGVHVPPDIDAEVKASTAPRNASGENSLGGESPPMLISTLIAKLVSRGYTIASQAAGGPSSGPTQAPEMVYTLIGP